MLTAVVVFRLECLCLLLIIPTAEGYSLGEEVEDIVVEGLLVQGLIEVEEYREEGSEGEVEGLLLLLKLCREGL